MTTSALDKVEELASNADSLKARLTRVTTVRDDAIRAAHTAGSTIAELSRATGLTRTMLYKIIEKGTPHA